MVSRYSAGAGTGSPLTDWSEQRIVVGGGCGLFGSYLVPRIVRAGARVTVVDNLDGGDLAALEQVRAVITFVQGDLRDRLTCESVLRGCDVFVNLAATASGIGFSRTHHSHMLIDNVLCGLVPLQAAQKNGVRHVVTVSTSCVYPDDAPVPTPELDGFIGGPEQVNAGYGWAKRVQELASRYVAKEHGVRATILRPFNLYGGNYPWRSAERGHVIPSLVKRILDGEEPLVVWGSGEQRRNFLHASDAAEVAWRIVSSGAEGPVNIGYEDDTRIADLVALICDVTGRHPAVIFDTNRPDGQMRKSADSTLLRALTDDYVPRISLRAGIEEMVRWYHERFR
jgi:nucleoside-diphosphate-sugar epimerase